MSNHLIINADYIAAGIRRIEVEAPNIARKRKPGQFVIVHLHDGSERVPLTIVDSDPQKGTITLMVQEAGKTTREINRLGAGDSINGILGPLGTATHIENFGHAVVIGGGVGTAVGFPMVKGLKQAGNRVSAIIGARSKDLIILEDEIRQIADNVYITTDDGSYGFHGFVTTQLQQLIDSGDAIDFVMAVGPLPMMRAIAEVTRPYKIPTVVSLNPIMIDGTGMCGGCRVTIGNQTKFACVDGPDFDAHQVDFDSLIKRNRAYQHEEACAIDRQLAAAAQSMTAKERMAIPRQVMPEQKPEERRKNFKEVNLGFSAELARLEAQRCLQCKKPSCMAGCPVEINIPAFIQKVVEGDFLAAAEIIHRDNVLGKVTGRVCPQTDQCEGVCILAKRGDPVAIGYLERFVCDYAEKQQQPMPVSSAEPKQQKVAVIGSGPAGLTCAGDLNRLGYQVTVFEAFHEFGGVLTYGIPEFRLPKKIVRGEVEALRAAGVIFEANTLIGVAYTIDELLTEQGFSAVFLGVGAGLPVFLNIPGESLIGIYSANEFLTRINLMKAYQFPQYDTPILELKGKSVAVIGGGNTALDSVRTALRLGAKEARIIYRRTENEMPGRVEEIKHAREEGVEFLFLNAPVEFVGDEKGWLHTVRLTKMALGEPDASGRRRPLPVANSTYDLPVDIVIVAAGNGSNPIIQKTTPDLAYNQWGNIIVDESSMATSKTGVFAGGDIVTGGATVILAMGAGRKAARAIEQYLQSKPA